MLYLHCTSLPGLYRINGMSHDLIHNGYQVQREKELLVCYSAKS